MGEGGGVRIPTTKEIMELSELFEASLEARNN
jgi:hypothetical protein